MGNVPLERCLQQSQSWFLHQKDGNPNVVTVRRQRHFLSCLKFRYASVLGILLLGFRQLCFKGADFGHFPTEYAVLPVLHATLLPKSFSALCKDPVPLNQIQDFLPKATLTELTCRAKVLSPKFFFFCFNTVPKIKNCSDLNFKY